MEIEYSHIKIAAPLKLLKNIQQKVDEWSKMWMRWFGACFNILTIINIHRMIKLYYCWLILKIQISQYIYYWLNVDSQYSIFIIPRFNYFHYAVYTRIFFRGFEPAILRTPPNHTDRQGHGAVECICTCVMWRMGGPIYISPDGVVWPKILDPGGWSGFQVVCKLLAKCQKLLNISTKSFGQF